MLASFARLTVIIAAFAALGCRSESEGSTPIGQVRAKVVSSFSPLSGPPGTVVTLLGADFTGAVEVTFANSTGYQTASDSGVSAIFTVVNDTKITATVPSGTVSGFIRVM